MVAIDLALLFEQYMKWWAAGHWRVLPVAGTRISTFTQADLASRNIQYVHTSEEETHSDDFTFTVSDGGNEVHTRTHTYTGLVFYEVSIDIMLFILYKVYILSPKPYPY